MELGRPRKEQLTDLVLEFLEAAVHEFLFAWQVYPKESFEQRRLYDVPIHMNRHPLLCEYIHSMLTGCRTWLLRGELEKLCVVILSKEGHTVRTLVVEAVWSAGLIDAEDSEEDQSLPLVQLEEAFRAGMVALMATPVSSGTEDATAINQPHSFRILAQTVEDAINQATAINANAVSNSWVLADPFWCEDQQQKKIFPVKTIYTETLPIRLNMYMETQQLSPETEASAH